MSIYHDIYDSILAKYNFVPARSSEEIPSRKTVYYAMKRGMVEKFDTRKEAESYSKIVEVVYEATEEYTRYFDTLTKIQQEAAEEWNAHMRKHYSDLTDAQYSVLHSAAYERSHSGGYSAVEDRLYEYYELVNKFNAQPKA